MTHYNEHGHPIPDGMTPQEWRAYLDAQVERVDAQAEEDALRRDNAAVPLPLPDWMTGGVPLRRIHAMPTPAWIDQSAPARPVTKRGLRLLTGCVAMSMIALTAFAYQAGVADTTRRVDRILNQQANAKQRDATFWAMCLEFPEDVE